jgi:excisionase family DNA binding protein
MMRAIQGLRSPRALAAGLSDAWRTPMNTDEIFTVEEGAADAKIAPKTLRTWLKSGQLPGLRAGRHWRVQKSVLQRFLREQGQKAVKRA